MQWSPSLLPLLLSWCPESFITPLIPLDWYEWGHGIQGGALSTCGICHTRESQDTWYLWAPAPTAAPSALEELQLLHNKRLHLSHIFVCPCLFTQYWCKRFHRLAGARTFWPQSMHKPLIIGLTLHFVCPSMATEVQWKTSGPGRVPAPSVAWFGPRWTASFSPTLRAPTSVGCPVKQCGVDPVILHTLMITYNDLHLLMKLVLIGGQRQTWHAMCKHMMGTICWSPFSATCVCFGT